MADSYKKSSASIQVVTVLAIALMVIDSNTQWLNAPRDWLSVITTPIHRLASIPTSVGRGFASVVGDEPDIAIAYENLRNEYFQLKSEMILLRAVEQENAELRAILSATKRVKEKVTLAELISINIDPNNHGMLISRGLRDGVFKGQTVVDDQGVIGQVIEVMPFDSSVMLVTDADHAIPVQVQRTGLHAMVYGTGQISVLNIPYLNQNSDIKPGDLLASSGLGGRFPVGYPVAKVTNVEAVKGEPFIKVSAEPIANLNRSKHVLLLTRDKTQFDEIPLLKNNSNETKLAPAVKGDAIELAAPGVAQTPLKSKAANKVQE